MQVSVTGKKIKSMLLKKMNKTNDYLYRILNMLDDFKEENKNLNNHNVL